MLEELLNSEGLKAVETYRKSFIAGKRYATGKTNKSIGFEVKKEETAITLTVYGRKDVNDLEEGVSAEEYTSNPATFSDLTQWIKAKGMNRTAQSVDEGLRENGWVSGNGPKGGTPGIITIPSEQILKSIQSKVEAISKDLVAKTINIKV